MAEAITARPWQEVQLTLTSARRHATPYVAVEAWADFTHESGTTLRRPAFWDGGDTWKVRFAPTTPGTWRWASASNIDDAGLSGISGVIDCQAGGSATNRFHRHGFWRMSPGGRNLVHADGRPILLAGDTAWGLPWRATPEQVEVYAKDRKAKGFNAALLMSVQPDMKATGPRSRSEDYGFDVGFEDLLSGHINEPIPEYFQRLDRLIEILVAHEIAPVWQPVFHGYGWKGMHVAGPVVPAEEYMRYCRYLVARYGARPAMWLINADGQGYLEQVRRGGEEVHAWDCYAQPTGMHYCPHADNRAWQDADWLDFQWCQTGHNGEHIPERVMDMWKNAPAKAVANGEPTYEEIGWAGNASDWWQGHEAWTNLCAGGTMGVVYGAGSLWQWRLHKDEPGYEAWAYAHTAGWREALDFPGSRYVGLMTKVLDGLPFADMEPNWDHTIGRRGLAVPGKLLIVYLSDGGVIQIVNKSVPQHYRVIDPRTGETVQRGDRTKEPWRMEHERGAPRVVIFCDEDASG